MEVLIVVGVIVFLIWLFSGNSSDNNKSLSQQEQTKIHQKNESDILLKQQREREIQEKKRQEEALLRKEREEREKREKEQQREREIQERKRQEEIALRKAKEEREKREKEQREEERKRSAWKSDWQNFQTALQQNGINKLYHFTDKSNIASIKQNGGLYSWWYCSQNNITIPKSGADDVSKSLDMRYDLQDYVRLSFTKNHPMMYVAQKQGRISNPVILEISTGVVFLKETRFSNMNATKTGHSQGLTIDDFKRIKFGVVKQTNHFDLQEDEKPYYQAEVMVKTFIPIEYITNINQF
jgi:hypothetical protein